MNILPRQALLAIAAVVDVAVHARPAPVAAKALATRNHLPPRHLETLLQALVRGNILKGVRGPRGGYELARERRRISAGAVVRIAMHAEADENGGGPSRLVQEVIAPMVDAAGQAFLCELDKISIDDLCRIAAERAIFSETGTGTDFTI